MAVKKRLVGSPGRNDYVYGNAARALAEPARKKAPQHKPTKDGSVQDRPQKASREERQAQQRRLHAQQRRLRAQQRALRMDLPLVVMLTVAAIAMMVICLNYLQVQISIAERGAAIQAKEQDLENLRSENDSLENRINTSIDLEEVYRIATEELGMVYANKDQVILYDRTESEYVRQNEDIPEYEPKK